MTGAKSKLVNFFIIGIFTSLYILVATISMINSVDFFDLSHDRNLAWSLAIGFEMGAAASLAAIIILDKTNKFLVWGLFLLLTLFQMMANSYHAFVSLEEFQGWIELFGLQEEEPLTQKRILAILSGAILPLVALGFIKSLVDYLRPDDLEAPKQIQAGEEIGNKKIMDVIDQNENIGFNYTDKEQSEEQLKTIEVVVEPKVVNDTTNMSVSDEEESGPEQDTTSGSDEGGVQQPQITPIKQYKP